MNLVLNTIGGYNMLTKKDFKAIAEIINGQRKYAKIFTGQHFAVGMCADIAIELAHYFATQNPRFDRDRFMKACDLD